MHQEKEKEEEMSYGYNMGICTACEREIEISHRNLCIWLCEPLIPDHIPEAQHRRYYLRVDGWKGLSGKDV